MNICNSRASTLINCLQNGYVCRVSPYGAQYIPCISYGVLYAFAVFPGTFLVLCAVNVRLCNSGATLWLRATTNAVDGLVPSAVLNVHFSN